MTAACPDLGCDNRRVSSQVLDMRCTMDVTHVTHVTHVNQRMADREDSITSFAYDRVPPGRDASSGCAADPGPSGLNPRNLPLSDGPRLMQVLPRGVKKSVSSTRLVSSSQASSIEHVQSSNGKSPVAALRGAGPFPVLRSGTSADQGRRYFMEDAHLQMDRCEELGEGAEGEGRAFYGVFDGHGGTGAASFVQAHILRHLAAGLSEAADMRVAFQAVYDRMDREFEIACAANMELHSGTTAIAVLISGRSLVVANAGDCRAVLCQAGRAVALSVDHTTTSEAERKRIEAAGGTVDSENYLNGQLGVARAIGDFHHEGLKSRGDLDRSSGPLICNPDVHERVLEEEDEFLIVGCDGLWDVFTSSDAVRFARMRLQSHNDPQQCSMELVAEALRRNTSDNLTVITVCLSLDKPKPLESKWRPKRCVSVDGLCTLQQSLME